MSAAPLEYRQVPQGALLAYGSANALIPSDMPVFSDQRLADAVERFNSIDARLREDTLPERLPQLRLEGPGLPLLRTTAVLIEGARLHRSEETAAIADTWESRVDPHPVVALEHVKTAQSLDRSAQQRWVEQADLEQLTAIATEANPASLEDHAFRSARERFWVLNWVARTGVSGSYGAKPSIDHILAVGVDEEAMHSAGRGYYEKSLERLETLDRMEATAQSIIAVLAVLFDRPFAEVLDRVLERGDYAAAA